MRKRIAARITTCRARRLTAALAAADRNIRRPHPFPMDAVADVDSAGSCAGSEHSNYSGPGRQPSRPGLPEGDLPWAT